MRSDGPIGVLDSGVGGLRLLAAALRALPDERFLYYGDFAHAPYGSKPPTLVAQYVEQGCTTLLARGAKALVLACNTATSAAVTELRARFAAPVIGIEPAVKPAAAAHPRGRVLVLATELTLREAKFRQLLARVGGQCVIDELPCPGLAAAIDAAATAAATATPIEPGAEDARLAAAEETARRILDRHPTACQADAVVLGCTHYGFVAEAIRAWFGRQPPIPLYDGIDGTVRRLAAVLESAGLARDRRANRADGSHAVNARERVELLLAEAAGENDDGAAAGDRAGGVWALLAAGGAG